MDSETNNKTKLSKSVLDMKFMKKTKERVEKEADDAEGHAMYSHEITENMRKSGQIIFMDTSIMNCKDLIDGRLSFGGMNSELERYMQNNYNKKIEEAEKKKEKEISDADMAKGYSLANTMGKKFQGRNKNKNKFMKPPPLE